MPTMPTRMLMVGIIGRSVQESTRLLADDLTEFSGDAAEAFAADRGEAHGFLLALVQPVHDLIFGCAGGEGVVERVDPGVVGAVRFGTFKGVVGVPVFKEDLSNLRA